jgi:hypothetical protein
MASAKKPRRVRLMELYINRNWTERYANAYIAEAIAWSEEGNHATIYCMGITAEEADAKLVGALRELNLTPEAPAKDGGGSKESRSG